MNSILLLIIGIPILEIIIMMEVGQQIGAINTISLILISAFIGISFARVQGLNTIKSGLKNIYQNKLPLFELISGASIAVAAMLLILPGFLTDFIGFVLLVPFTRSVLIKFFFKNTETKNNSKDDNVLDGEIVSKNEDNEKNKK
jgi:UPF0716 protein FxsA